MKMNRIIGFILLITFLSSNFLVNVSAETGVDWESTIKWAQQIKNNAVVKYNNSTRSALQIENKLMTVKRWLKLSDDNTSKSYTTSIKPPNVDDSAGNWVFENSMDVIAKDEFGNAFKMNDSGSPGRANMYRHGLYYQDAHIFDNKMKSTDNITTAPWFQYEFDSQSDIWSGNSNISNISVSAGEMNVQISNSLNPQITKTGINQNIAKTNVEIRLKHNISSGNAVLYFTTNDSPNFDETKKVTFELVSNSTDYYIYRVDMAQNQSWTGTLKDLRLAIVGGTGAYNISIDYIRFLSNYENNWLTYDFTDSSEVWSKSSDISSISIANSILQANVGGSSDPWISKGNINTQIQGSIVELNLKITGKISSGTIYFTSSTDTSMGDNYINFDVNSAINKYGIIRVDMSAHPGWGGSLQTFRVDLNGSDTTTVLQIDSIKFQIPSSYTFDFNAQGDAWSSNKMTVGVLGGIMTAVATDPGLVARDPYISKSGLNVPIGDDYLELYARVTGKTTSGEIFFTVSGTTGISRVPFDFTPAKGSNLTVLRINMAQSANWKGNLTSLRIDLSDSAAGDKLEIDYIKLLTGNPDGFYLPAKVEQVFHVYPDRLFQQVRIHPTGETFNLGELYQELVLPKSKLATIEAKDANGTYTYSPLNLPANGVISTSMRYVGIDTGNRGSFGLIFPPQQDGYKVTITSDTNNIIIRQYSYSQRLVIEPNNILNVGAARWYYTTKSGIDGLSELREANIEENDPILNSDFTLSTAFKSPTLIPTTTPESWVNPGTKPSLNTSMKVTGYNRITGVYEFDIGSMGFNSAYYYYPDLFPHLRVTVNNKAMRKRNIYMLVRSTSGGALEGSVLRNSAGYVMPVDVEVAKNFSGEKEDDFYYPGDPQYCESYFPIELAQGQSMYLEALHLYQNWGKYPLKQVSAVRFFVPYFHLSTGVSETNCWVPFSVNDGANYRTGWILPDFRARSSKIWSSQPQYDSVGKLYLYEHKGLKMENVHSYVKSPGPVYSDLLLNMLMEDGTADVDIRSIEMPQTDENRTYVEMKVNFKKAISFSDVSSELSIFKFNSRNTSYQKLGYLGQDNQPQVKTIDNNTANLKEVIKLGTNAPYFTYFNSKYALSPNGGTNAGVVVLSSDIKAGGQTYNDGLSVVNKNVTGNALFNGAWQSINMNEGTLTLSKNVMSFQPGDYINIKMVLLPWGIADTTVDDNIRKVWMDSALNPLIMTPLSGESLNTSTPFVPTITMKNKMASFKLSGGKDVAAQKNVNYAVRIEGCNNITPPNIYKKQQGASAWQKVDLGFNNGLDIYNAGRNGYEVYIDDAGKYGFAFVTEANGLDTQYVVTENEQTPALNVGFTNAQGQSIYLISDVQGGSQAKAVVDIINNLTTKKLYLLVCEYRGNKLVTVYRSLNYSNSGESNIRLEVPFVVNANKNNLKYKTFLWEDYGTIRQVIGSIELK